MIKLRMVLVLLAGVVLLPGFLAPDTCCYPLDNDCCCPPENITYVPLLAFSCVCDKDTGNVLFDRCIYGWSSTGGSDPFDDSDDSDQSGGATSGFGYDSEGNPLW